MSIAQIVDQALQEGCLTASMKAKISGVTTVAAELDMEDYMALDRLTDALMQGTVVMVPPKQAVNVMEELVLIEATARIARLESNGPTFLDLGDISAYALNRLPPLYATTEEGAAYQRDRANETLRPEIIRVVQEAIARSMVWPDFPDRQALQPQEAQASAGAATQLATWLRNAVNRRGKAQATSL
ncbi:MAG: late competence development ComFB family protein [Elainellaceae cyanobacterium]